MNFNDLVNSFKDIGGFDVFLPFVLIFTISFAVLQKAKILGDKKNINAVVALVIGLLLVQNQNIVNIINTFLPNISLVLVVILMFLLVVGIFVGGEKRWDTGGWYVAAIIISIIFVGWSFFASSVSDRWNLPYWLTNIDSQTISVIIFIAIFLIVIYWISKEEKKT
ncbi:MAG: hypothetical protein V1815_01715 [Candidatus Woesearchaeota archaeon]